MAPIVTAWIVDSFQALVEGLVTAQVRFVVIGVWGANYKQALEDLLKKQP